MSSLVSKFESSLTLKDRPSVMNTCAISEELGAMITKICYKYRDVSLDSIEYIFNREFLYELNLQKQGFNSFEELIECLIQNNYPIEWQQNREGVYCLRTNRHYFYWLSHIKCNRNYHLMNILSDIPEDVISCDQQLSEFQFPKDVKMNGCPEILSGDILNELNYCEIRLMTARSPHEIYLNICGEDYHNAYHNMRRDMRFYDKKDTEKYRIPSLLLFEGVLCAVKYPKICDEWHRSRLLSIDRYNNCRLFLVDIGDIIETNANNLRLLLKSFAILPAQALKAQLIGIRPAIKTSKSNKWSDWAKNAVIKLEDHNYSGKMECAFIDYNIDRYRVYIRYYQRFKSSNINDLLFLHQFLIDKRLAVISGNDIPID